MTDPELVQAFLAKCLRVADDDELRQFCWSYGNVRDYFEETTQGQAMLKDHPDWPLLTVFRWEQVHLVATEKQKWGIDKDDFVLYTEPGEGVWAAAVGCDGMFFLWPVDHHSSKPPAARCKQVHGGMTMDFVVDFKLGMAITVGSDCKLSVYDMKRDDIITSVKAPGAADPLAKWLSVDADLTVGKAAVGTSGNLINIADLTTQKVLFQLKGHTRPVHGVKVDWDNHKVVSCSWDSCLNIYDLRSCKCEQKLQGHKGICNRMAVDFDKQLAITVAEEVKFILWDIRQARALRTYASPTSTDVSVNWEKMVAATGGDDGLVHFWDLATGECTKTMDCEHKQTQALDVDWEKGLVLTGSWDDQVQLFDIESGERVKAFHKARRVLTRVSLQK